MSNQDLLPCPFCGRQPGIDHPDTLHPSGVVWVQHKHFRSYHSRSERPDGNSCWSLNCCECCGGCGVEVTADTREEAIAKWNTRAAPLGGVLVVHPDDRATLEALPYGQHVILQRELPKSSDA